MLSFALPPEDLLRTSLWRPMELTVLWGTAGAVSAPVLIRGSGVPEVDERIQDLVRSDLLPGLRLRPGMYRLVAGP
jgi:hypothetical protein